VPQPSSSPALPHCLRMSSRLTLRAVLCRETKTPVRAWARRCRRGRGRQGQPRDRGRNPSRSAGEAAPGRRELRARHGGEAAASADGRPVAEVGHRGLLRPACCRTAAASMVLYMSLYYVAVPLGGILTEIRSLRVHRLPIPEHNRCIVKWWCAGGHEGTSPNSARACQLPCIRVTC
jgi:hypothetical protein